MPEPSPTFEALVAQIVADYVNNFKPGREDCWIAEMNGEPVGSVFCVQASETGTRAEPSTLAPGSDPGPASHTVTHDGAPPDDVPLVPAPEPALHVELVGHATQPDYL